MGRHPTIDDLQRRCAEQVRSLLREDGGRDERLQAMCNDSLEGLLRVLLGREPTWPRHSALDGLIPLGGEVDYREDGVTLRGVAWLLPPACVSFALDLSLDEAQSSLESLTLKIGDASVEWGRSEARIHQRFVRRGGPDAWHHELTWEAVDLRTSD